MIKKHHEAGTTLVRPKYGEGAHRNFTNIKLNKKRAKRMIMRWDSARFREIRLN